MSLSKEEKVRRLSAILGTDPQAQAWAETLKVWVDENPAGKYEMYECSECGQIAAFEPNDYICRGCRLGLK